MTQNSFILYTSYYKLLDHLTIKERGFLWTAVFEYIMKKEETKLPPKVRVVFEMIKNQLELDHEKYEKIIERNRENAAKHSKKAKQQHELKALSDVENQDTLISKKTSGFFGLPNDNENENENVNVNVNENENVNENDNRIVKGRRKGFASLGEILSASPFSSPENGVLPVRAQGEIGGITSVSPLSPSGNRLGGSGCPPEAKNTQPINVGNTSQDPFIAKGKTDPSQGTTRGAQGDKRMPPDLAGSGGVS